MYQTATKVNVLSPVKFNIKEADSVHVLEGNTEHSVKVRDAELFRGLRQWYGTERNLQELGRSGLNPEGRIFADNLEKRGSEEGRLEVGLIHSRGVAGVASSETASHSKGLALLCNGKGKHIRANELEVICLQN